MNNNFLDGGGILCQGVESPRVLRRLVGVSQADWVSDLGNERAKILKRLDGCCGSSPVLSGNLIQNQSAGPSTATGLNRASGLVLCCRSVDTRPMAIPPC